ncbi:integrase catalytic domain-containing protein [Trichonephila clavata]|uniref:Integrase catalytic domain-containing protein n=1 Tax=Trichonephila clavata TaxID=2740835 RepID=A0A8X6FQT6_TRICU|nr:integrase catalytic domain-containing protein [Trichonephila clavata]
MEVNEQKNIWLGISRINDSRVLEKLATLNVFISDSSANNKLCLFEKHSDEIHILLGSDIVGKLFTGERKISDLWELDSLGIKDPSEKRSKLELQDLALKHFENTILRDDEGRCIVSIPWIEGSGKLEDHYSLAKGRLEKTVKTLKFTGRLFDYEQVFLDWEKEGIIEKIAQDEPNKSHRISDPIGFACPITLIPKLLIQECWKIEASWDSKLPVDIERKFQVWKKQLIETQDIKIPRRLSNLDPKDANLSLRFFRDAMKSSYARHDFHLPFILSSNHPVIKALINYKHIQLGHDGVHTLRYKLRENVWIRKRRNTIKEVIKLCIICKRFNVKPISVSEGLLPQDRVRDAAIFEIKELDLTRLLILKNGEKNWILILICAVYSAFHLELLTSVSTENFLLGLRKFIARRGRPSVICSDNGTNFKGVYRLLQKVNLEKLKNLEKLNPISWKLIPSQVPWWGGFWDHNRRINWNLDANEGSLPINIDPELCKHQAAATPSTQPCSSVSNGGARLEPRAETSSHQQAETSSMQP